MFRPSLSTRKKDKTRAKGALAPTMNDLFGSGASNMADDLPTVFTEATDYGEITFGSSPLDPAAAPMPLGGPTALAPKKKRNSMGEKGAIKSPAANNMLRRTFGGGKPKAKQLLKPVAPSSSSFEEVFKGGEEEFEMANPFIASGVVKDAAARVLYDQTDSVEEKARKLFFLDQLNKPAPPVVPPRGWEAQRLESSQHVSKSVKPARGTGVKKKVGHKYDPSHTAMGVASSEFYRYLDVMTAPALEIGWRLRVEIMRDAMEKLLRLHKAELAHNALEDQVYITVDGLRSALGDEKATVAPIKDDAMGRGRKMRDVLALGSLIFRACTKAATGPRLEQVLKLERAAASKQQFENLPDACMALSEECDREVREALAHAMTPGSLLELCAQCCSADSSTRPSAEDAWDWLDSIVDDMDKAAGHDAPLQPSDQVDQVVAKARTAGLRQMHSPKLCDVTGTTPDSAAAEELGSDATASDAGYASDDSFQPPVAAAAPEDKQAMAAREEKRKSKLLDFLSEAPAPGARPMSLNLTGAGGKLSDFLTSAQVSAPAGGDEARQHELTRRRSLDRGYMWAKQKFAPDVPLTAPKKKVDAKNVGEFADAWKVAQGTSKARKPEEVSELFTQQNRLPQDEAIAIIKKAEGVMKKEKNLLELKPPVVVVGDIHGQFFDLVNMMSKAGMPGKGKNKTVYVFLGDYVDRGDFSCEVLIYLLSLKAEYPDSVYLLRGNHECRTVSSYFGFKEEAEAKYGLTVFNRCMAAFQAMPIAALLETQAGRFLCCHGGISPNITSLDQFAEYNRFVEPGMNGFLCDLLWSDPVKDAHEDGSDMTLGDFLSIDYLPNPARGCSYRYGFKALVSFLAVNKLVAIVRAHEVQMGGYRYHFQELTGGKGKAAINVMPPVVTIFSAPNYCARYGNKGAFLRVHANPPFKKPKDKSKGKGAGFKPLELLEPVQFTDVAHPPPMHFKNQQAEQEGQIAKTCPYMPTTFHAFVKRAVDLAQEDQDEKQMAKEKAKAKLAIAPVPLPLPKPKPAAPESTAEQESDEEEVVVVVRPKSLGRQMLQSVQSMAGVKVEDSAEVTASKADIAAKKNWKALQQLGLDKPEDSVPSGKKHVNVLEKKAVQKFEAAAENDGINEMNPMMLAEKVALAKQKIAEKHLDEDVTVVTDSPSQATGRKTLTSKRSSMRLKVGDRSRPESLTRGMKTVASEKQILATEEESAMTFTSQELLSLQLLFLLVDRQDKGLIDVEDLVAWSAEEGFAVPVEEAEICMRAVDADADGKIGFEDYLAFAARSKDKWLVSEYSNVLSQVRDMQATNASSAAAVPAGF